MEADLEAELLAAMEAPSPAPAPAPAPAAAPAEKRPSKRLKRSHGSSSSAPGGIEALAMVATADRQPSNSSAAAGGSADDAGGDDAPGYMWGMNIVTGKTRAEEEEEAAAAAAAQAEQSGGAAKSDEERKRPQGKLVELRYGSYAGLQLGAAEVRRIKAEECRALLARRKLSLVLDLDHTLLNSAMYSELNQEQGEKLEAWHDKVRGIGIGGEKEAGASAEEGAAAASGEASGAAAGSSSSGAAAGASGDGDGDGDGVDGEDGTPKPMLHHLRHIFMWTKLRPYVHEFLKAASERYELYVYTMGAKAYAKEMVNLLDPTGSLGLSGNSDRVIGKEDSTESHTKDLDVILGSERTTLIVDDSPAVWPRFKAQLLVPRRYHFFPSSSSKDGSLPEGFQPPLITEDDEPAEDGQLHAILTALINIHTHYFAGLDGAAASASLDASQPPHVSDSVRAIRRQVLKGKTLVFSHVIPLDQQKTPEKSAEYRLATELGATMTNTLGSKVTHVVAGSDGTDKVRWARSHKVHAVSIDWLASCSYLWRVVDEAGKPIEKVASGKGPAALPDQTGWMAPPDVEREISSNSSSGSEEKKE